LQLLGCHVEITDQYEWQSTAQDFASKSSQTLQISLGPDRGLKVGLDVVDVVTSRSQLAHSEVEAMLV